MLFNLGLYITMPTLFLLNTYEAKNNLLTDIRYERSSSKSFGEFGNRSKTYNNAIIIPEPDYAIESLPYYAKNKIYFPRENRFGTTVSFTTGSNKKLSLSESLSAARNIKSLYKQPVLTVLGHWNIDDNNSGEENFSYNKTFSWNAEGLRDFDESTKIIAKFKTAITIERYRVYVLE